VIQELFPAMITCRIYCSSNLSCNFWLWGETGK